MAAGITHHARIRLAERYKGIPPDDLADELVDALERWDFEPVAKARNNLMIARVVLPAATVFALLGEDRTVVSVLRPGMKAFVGGKPLLLPEKGKPKRVA